MSSRWHDSQVVEYLSLLTIHVSEFALYLSYYFYSLYDEDGSLYLYSFICLSASSSSRMIALLLYHSIAPCTSKGDISASAICHLRRFAFSFNI